MTTFRVVAWPGSSAIERVRLEPSTVNPVPLSLGVSTVRP
jgi:hypothetical protein